MRRRSFLPSASGPSGPSTPGTSGPSRPAAPAPAPPTRAFSLFRRPPPAPPPRAPAPLATQRARQDTDELSVLDITARPPSVRSGEAPGAGRAPAEGRERSAEGRGEEQEESERSRLREEAARSLGWAHAGSAPPGPSEAGAVGAPSASTGNAAPPLGVGVGVGGGGAAAKSSFLPMPGKGGRRHSIQALLSSAHTHSPTPPAPAPAPAAGVGAPGEAGPARPRPADRLSATHGPAPPFPSPLSAFNTASALHASPALFPPAPGLFGLRKPRPRLLLLTPQGALHVFPGRNPGPRQREADRLDLVAAEGGSVSAVLLDPRSGAGKKQQHGEEHMLRVDGLAAGKPGGAGAKTSWTFALGSRAEMGEWIRVIERVLEGSRAPPKPPPAAASVDSAPGEGRAFELLRPSLPGPTLSYPSAFRAHTPAPSPSPSPSPSSRPSPEPTEHAPPLASTSSRTKRQSRAPEPRSTSPITALPIGPKPRLSTRPSTAPSRKSLPPPAPPGSGAGAPPTVDPRDPAGGRDRHSRRRGSIGAGELGQPLRSPDSLFSPGPALTGPQPPIPPQQLGQHPFGASSTSLRDREVRESLPPPRRPRPGSVSGARPLSPAPSTSSALGAPPTRDGRRTPEAEAAAAQHPPLPSGGGPKELQGNTANLPHSPRRTRTPKRPSTAPSLPSPAGALPPTSAGSLKRRSGMLPPISPPPNHPIPAPPVELALSPSDIRSPRAERRLSAMSALPGPPTTNGTGGYVNGTRSRTGSAGGRTVRLLPDTPDAASPDLVGLGITSPNIQRRLTPPPRPPPTGALPALPVDTGSDEFGISTRAQKHRSLPASPTKSGNPPTYAALSQSPENVLGDSLVGGNSPHDFDSAVRRLQENATQQPAVPTIKTDTCGRKKGESFFEGPSPDLDAGETWDKPLRESSVLLGEDADRFWKEATKPSRPVSDADGRYERPSQDSGDIASTSTKTSFEAHPISYGTGVDMKNYEGRGVDTPTRNAGTVTRA
ncbi:hypothetical protein CALCODRAFT_511173 [Calocera cornea HHB12733]|uniref:PH domain-containing protein n=1 Tax=Calocera cornea HHB12733 TaxID=1353952 RepID=A0A165DZS2_9BASI|nr:hypothetical protein CALCODRAFT_511173 [Calocera cornea HHB12733]